MQAGKPYKRSHVEALLHPFDNSSPWLVDDRGVWPAADFKESDKLDLVPEYEILSWKPVMVFKNDHDAPDCKSTPALAFPFNAGDLAAFMLEGVGDVVAKHYGDWEDGPNEDALSEIDPGDNQARQALCKAFNAYREALKKVGARPVGLHESARILRNRYTEARSAAFERERVFEVPHAQGSDSLESREKLHDEYQRRKMRALEPLKELDEKVQRAQADANAADEAWLKAMVVELLGPDAVAQATYQDAPKCDVPAPDSATPTAAQSTDNTIKLPLKGREKRRTWMDATTPYIVEVIRSGQYATAKELFAALEKRAGPDSPFERGTGAHRNGLFVREISQTVRLKTFGNKFSELRRMALDLDS